MKIKISKWEDAKKIERIVKRTISKYSLVRQREKYLLKKGLNVKFSYIRDYNGVGNHQDYLLPNGIVERRIIVGRPYVKHRGSALFEYRPSRAAICVIVKANANEVTYKKIT